jgi:hypothetical protein
MAIDSWLLALASSAKRPVHRKGRDLDDSSVPKTLFDAYERESMATAENRQTVQFVTQVAARTPMSIG